LTQAYSRDEGISKLEKWPRFFEQRTGFSYVMILL